MTRAPEGRGAALGRNVAWALVGNAGYAACQWGLLVVIARLGTAADVGRFALALALTAPVFTLANMGLRMLQATDARDEFPFGAYLGLRLLSTTGALGAVAVTGLLLGYAGPTLALVLALGLAKAVEAVIDVFFGVFQRREDMRRIALSLLTKGIASVVVVAVGLHVTGSVALATLAMAAAWTVQLALQDRPAAARATTIRPRWERRYLTPLVRLALPAGIVSSLGSLAVSLPRFAIERDLGAAPLGQFATMAYALVAVTQPMLALGAALAPRLGQSFHTERAAYRELTRHALLVAVAFGGVVVAATAVAGRPFLELAYGAAYAADRQVFVWLALATAAGFVATALGAAVTAARRLREQAFAAGLVVLVCAVTSHVLVPRYGLVGAAWAVLASEASRLVCLGVVYARVAAGGGRIAERTERPLVASPRAVEVSR